VSVVGRNDPCPCGSGQKYKRCCAKKLEVEDRSLRAARALGALGMSLLMDFLRDTYGHRLEREAWPIFANDDIPMHDDHQEVGQLFVAWASCHWAPDGRPPARQWMETASEPMKNPELRAWADACLQAPFTFLEVQSIDRGRGAEVLDLLVGQRMFIHDRSFSEIARPWLVVFAKPVTYGGHSFLEAVGPVPFEPRLKDAIVDAARAVIGCRKSKALQPADLLAKDLELLDVYRGIAQEARQPRPLRLQNTDGHPMVLCTTTYRVLDLGRLAEALGRLEGLDPMEGPDAGKGWSWIRAGNRLHPDWENTLVASLRLGIGTLRLETNSRERDAEFRAQLEKGGAGLLEYVGTEQEDATDADAIRRIAPEASESGSDTGRLPPEVEREAVRALMERHYNSWPDTHLPALDGKTPRQAARTKAGRNRVEGLIREMEFRQTPGHVTFDFNRLRVVLGLVGPTGGKRRDQG